MAQRRRERKYNLKIPEKMTQEDIQTAYKIALEHTTTVQEAVQVGFQMAINKEVSFNEDGTIQIIE